MKKILFILFGLIAFGNVNAFAAENACKTEDMPKVIKPMENYDIIATNTGNINTNTVFSGKDLSYSVSAHPKNRQNKISINKNTGLIKIVAEKKDNFDVTVKVKNTCGTASNKFNVIIDEEE